MTTRKYKSKVVAFVSFVVVVVSVAVYLSTRARGSAGNTDQDLPLVSAVPQVIDDKREASDELAQGKEIEPDTEEESTGDGETPGIEFPDGTIVQVAWLRPTHLDRPLVEPLGQHYETLRQQALAGDPNAAFDLYGILDSCSNAVETESELRKTKDRLLETHMVVIPAFGEEELYVEDPEQVQIAIDMFERDYNRCIGITAQHKSEKDLWLEKAKDGGPELAIFLYATQMADSDESLSYLELAWQAGFMLSLPTMAEMYLEAYNSGQEPIGDISAYAATYAYSKLLENRRIEFDSAKLGFDVPTDPEEGNANRRLEEMASVMQDFEIQEAIELAKKMISSNSNCCFVY